MQKSSSGDKHPIPSLRNVTCINKSRITIRCMRKQRRWTWGLQSAQRTGESIRSHAGAAMSTGVHVFYLILTCFASNGMCCDGHGHEERTNEFYHFWRKPAIKHERHISFNFLKNTLTHDVFKNNNFVY